MSQPTSAEEGGEVCSLFRSIIVEAAAEQESPADFYRGFISHLTGIIAAHTSVDQAIATLREIADTIEKGRAFLEQPTGRMQ